LAHTPEFFSQAFIGVGDSAILDGNIADLVVVDLGKVLSVESIGERLPPFNSQGFTAEGRKRCEKESAA